MHNWLDLTMIKRNDSLQFLDALTSYINNAFIVRYSTVIKTNDRPLYFLDALTIFISRKMDRIRYEIHNWLDTAQ